MDTTRAQVVIVRPCGELDQTATNRLVDDVTARMTDRTSLIVVSFAATTSVRWDALCQLGGALQRWRAAMRDVVVREARPSLRAVLANVEGMAN